MSRADFEEGGAWTSPRRAATWARRAVVLGALLASLWASLPATWERARIAREDFSWWRRLDEVAARRRIAGEFADGIERIKAALPENASYLVAETVPDGSLYFVVYELAPRRARLLGEASRGLAGLRAAGPPPDAPAFVVVAHGVRAAPSLMTTAELFSSSGAR